MISAVCFSLLTGCYGRREKVGIVSTSPPSRHLNEVELPTSLPADLQAIFETAWNHKDFDDARAFIGVTRPDAMCLIQFVTIRDYGYSGGPVPTFDYSDRKFRATLAERMHVFTVIVYVTDQGVGIFRNFEPRGGEAGPILPATALISGFCHDFRKSTAEESNPVNKAAQDITLAAKNTKGFSVLTRGLSYDGVTATRTITWAHEDVGQRFVMNPDLLTEFPSIAGGVNIGQIWREILAPKSPRGLD
jgi:hypothetical protein